MISVYFEPIIPEPFNEGLLSLFMVNEGRKIANEIERDFKRTVATWKTKPKFTKEVHFSKSELLIEVSTDDENYRRVSEGTAGKPRVARGVGPFGTSGAKALTIIPYIPKTVPGKIDARSGGDVEGGPIIFRRYALNAGKIKPRDFDFFIQELWDKKFAARLQKALDAAAAKSGIAF